MPLLIWRNFVVSVWVLIGVSVVQFVILVGDPATSPGSGPFASRFYLRPLAIAMIEGLLWLLVFGPRVSGAGVMAAFMGIALLIQAVLIPLVTASLYDLRLDGIRIAFNIYVAASHLAYAVASRGARS